MEALLTGLAIALLIWTVVAVSNWRTREEHEEWVAWGEEHHLTSPQTPTTKSIWIGGPLTQLSAELSLQFQKIPDLPTGRMSHFLQGEQGGVQLATFTHTHTVHGGKVPHTINHQVFGASLRKDCADFSLRRHQLLDNVAKAFGYPDLEAGDSEFDERYYIFGQGPDLVIETLTAGVRQIIRESGLDNWSVVGSWLIAFGGATGPTETTLARLTTVASVARLIDQAHSEK